MSWVITSPNNIITAILNSDGYLKSPLLEKREIMLYTYVQANLLFCLIDVDVIFFLVIHNWRNCLAIVQCFNMPHAN